MQIESNTLEILVKEFRNGASLIDLSRLTSISKFRIRQALRCILDEEYWTLSKAILTRKRSNTTRKKMSDAAKQRNLNPEWAKKVIETKRQRGYFEIQSKRHKEWMKKYHPTRGKKHNEQSRTNMQKARQKFYDNGGIAGMTGHTHSQATKDKLRDITKRMWQEGKFCYNKDGLWRSKLEIMVYEEIIKYDHDTQHSFKIVTQERTYIYDIYVPSRNLLIEINGDYWHLNPTKYDASYIDESRNTTAQGIWDADAKKCQVATQVGYNILTLWENTIHAIGTQEIVYNVCTNHFPVEPNPPSPRFVSFNCSTERK